MMEFSYFTSQTDLSPRTTDSQDAHGSCFLLVWDCETVGDHDTTGD